MEREIKRGLKSVLSQKLRDLLNGERDTILIYLSDWLTNYGRQKEWVEQLGALEEEISYWLEKLGYLNIPEKALKRYDEFKDLAYRIATDMDDYVWGGGFTLWAKKDGDDVIALKMFFFDENNEDYGFAIRIFDYFYGEEEERFKEVLKEIIEELESKEISPRL